MHSATAVLLLVAPCAAMHQLNSTSDRGGCVAPGRCTPYPAKYSNILPLLPRTQWNLAGGFCGSLAMQSGALAFGAWISQDLIRKANTHGEGHGSSSEGYEILPSNIGESATNLKLKFDEWDWKNTPKPQSPAYKAWLKKHLAAGHPCVWLVMCKGDGACPYKPYDKCCPNGGAFSHVEAVWGIGSNHPLNDTTVYDDDWLLHGSDQDTEPYYRPFSTLVDTTAMDGNCAHAGTYPGKNEMYPCINDQTNYGIAITGVVTPGALPVVLQPDSPYRHSEPNIREYAKPGEMTATATVSGLKKGEKYVLYRYGTTKALPTTSTHTGYDFKVEFTADGDTYTYKDSKSFLTSSATYYVAVHA